MECRLEPGAAAEGVWAVLPPGWGGGGETPPPPPADAAPPNPAGAKVRQIDGEMVEVRIEWGREMSLVEGG